MLPSKAAPPESRGHLHNRDFANNDLARYSAGASFFAGCSSLPLFFQRDASQLDTRRIVDVFNRLAQDALFLHIFQKLLLICWQRGNGGSQGGMIWGILCDFWEVADNLIITESSCGLTDDYYQDVLLQALAMRAKQRGQQVTFGALAQRLLYRRGSFPAWLDLQLIIDFCGELQHQPVRLLEWYVIPPPALYRDEKLIQCLQLGIRTSIRYLIFLQVGISGQD